MSGILKLILNAVAVVITAYLIPGVVLENYFTALVVAIILGILNTVLKPILVILTLPITVLTLGLFILIINVFIILLASRLVPGFEVSSLFTALAFSLVLSVISSFLNSLAK